MPPRSASPRVLALSFLVWGLAGCEPPSGPGLDGDEGADATEAGDVGTDTDTTGPSESESSSESESASESESTSESESEDSSESTTTGPPDPLPITQDGFDPLRDRWVRSGDLDDDDKDELITVDPLTGVESVLTEAWPWPEDHDVSVRSLALDTSLEWAHVFVNHSYYDPEIDLYCLVEDYVRADLETGEVEPLAQLGFGCCDDCGDGTRFDSPVFDPASETLRYIHANCDPNACQYTIREADPLTLELLDSEFIYDGYCKWEEFDCTPGLWDDSPRGLTVDPRAEQQVLAFTRGAEWFTLDLGTLDTQLESFLPELLDGELLDVDNARKYMVLDYTNWRTYAVVPEQEGYATVRQDLDGSLPVVVHASSPGEQPSTECIRDAAFDSVRNRVLYWRWKYKTACPESAYLAVDVDAGTVELLSP